MLLYSVEEREKKMPFPIPPQDFSFEIRSLFNFKFQFSTAKKWALSEPRWSKFGGYARRHKTTIMIFNKYIFDDDDEEVLEAKTEREKNVKRWTEIVFSH